MLDPGEIQTAAEALYVAEQTGQQIKPYSGPGWTGKLLAGTGLPATRSA